MHSMNGKDNVVLVLVQSQKLIFHFEFIYTFELIEEMDGLRRKLKGKCPCGYSFEVLGSRDDAISMVRLHFESFHKDFLPFGITNDEAIELLNQGHKPKISASTPIQCI